jgi:hypothetical protein
MSTLLLPGAVVRGPSHHQAASPAVFLTEINKGISGLIESLISLSICGLGFILIWIITNIII